MSTESKNTNANQLIINKVEGKKHNVILNGMLLFCTERPDIEDILDAYGLKPVETPVLIDGVFNDSYLTKESIQMIKEEAPQTDEDILRVIGQVTFDSNSENLLKAAGVGPSYTMNKSQLPTIGDKIYVPSQNGIFVNVQGGKATVEEVLEKNNVHYVIVEELPNMLFRWDEINIFQMDMEKEFCESAAAFVTA